MGRTWQLGDPMGSQLVATQIVEYLIKQSFLIEHRYAPYARWLGTAFKELQCYPEQRQLLVGILSAPDYPQCEPCLVKTYTLLADLHNALQITRTIDVRTRTYSGWHVYNAEQRELELDDPKKHPTASSNFYWAFRGCHPGRNPRPRSAGIASKTGFGQPVSTGILPGSAEYSFLQGIGG